jgi:dTDP-4-dehydrorhamnose 3,5-epimerase
VVDLRVDTPSDVEFFEMSEGDEIIVPKGYAHGFITLEDNTVVQYLVDNEYNPSSEGNLVWTNFESILDKIKEISPEFDPSKVIISKKDLI